MRETDLADRGPSDIEWDVSCALRALKCELSAQRVLRSGRRILALLRTNAYNPAQPRDDLGRWALVGTSLPVTVPGEPAPAGQDGRVLVAGAFDWGLVDLREEETGGGHAIAEHVGKTDAEMMARLRQDYYDFGVYQLYLERDGSFPSIESANKLVNSTLARNAPVVEAVASGQYARRTIFAEFGSPTGREAYRSNPRSQPLMRDTYAVGVTIDHDPKQSKGFRVRTAFPRNP